MIVKINRTILELKLCDITDMDTDAIVNTANVALQLGGGVAGAIRRKGGPKIQEECNKIGGTHVGSAVLTTGGNLKAKYVIHAVGPIHGEEHDDEKLKNATLNTLILSDKNGLKSLAFPAISTGIFRFPKERCATIMLSTTIAYPEGLTKLEKVIYCLYDRNTFETFKNPNIYTLIIPKAVICLANIGDHLRSQTLIQNLKGAYMDTNLDCILCFQRQVMQAVSFITDDEVVREHVLREVMKKLLELKWSLKPMDMANEVHRIVRTVTKVKDPYERVKKESNNLVLELYPRLKLIVEESVEPLRTAIKLAIAGNIIDFGALKEFDLEKTIKEVTAKRLLIDDCERLKEKLKDAKTLLFFADNAGEIGFDKLLIETMLKEKTFNRIGFVVKGGPIINDATLEEALYMGLNELPHVKFLTISNGEKGTGPTISSQEVDGWVKAYDVIISKGQANYEGLSEFSGIFFMLIAKCPIVALDLGANIGDTLLKYKP